MASKLTALAALIAPTAGALLYIVEDPDGTPTSKKIAVANLFGNVPANSLAVGTNQLVVSGGNVGIGTTGPGYKLEVNGTGYFGGTLLVKQTEQIGDAVVPTATLNFNNASNPGDDRAVIRLNSGGSERANIGFGQETGTGKGYITFDTGGSTDLQERVRITTSGNVGIGTTGPGSRLDLDAGAMTMAEMTAPGGAANKVRLYAEDNGAGKTRLMAIFGSGAAQQIAIEP